MPAGERATWVHAGRFCRKCEEEITEDDVILVDEDAEYDGDGCWRDLTRVEHVACPPEEA
jgi:hypothetical protein